MAKLLVTGSSGFLGSYTAMQGVKTGWDTWAGYSSHPVEIPGCSMIKLDICDEIETMRIISEIKPDVIIHSAAIPRPDLCEERKDLAFAVNTLGTFNIAVAAETTGAHLVHVSTDMVFQGDKAPYNEDDPLSPPNYYGLTKAGAESAVYASGANRAIVRTTTLYGPRTFPNQESFTDKLIESLRDGREMPTFVNQYRPAIPVWNVAEALVEIAERRMEGIYHVVCPDITTRYQVGLKIAELFDLDASLIKPVSVDDVEFKARRPKMLAIEPTATIRALNTRILTFEEGIIELRKRMG
ncbi:MAG: SDR family oxidoreductase [Armatimonadota bacterium]